MSTDPIQELTDELFCTRFELQTLAGSMVEGRLERWVPGFTSSGTHEQHAKRYEWSCQFVKGKRVLDIACGVGRGTYLLAEMGGAAAVCGVDIDEDAIRYASIRNAHANAKFSVGDAQTFRSEIPFDVVIGFETIEHLPDVPAYLKTVSAALAPDGVFLVSTPISRKHIDHHPDNPFHRIEWGMGAFAEQLGEHFSIEKTFVQLRQPPKTLAMKILPGLAKKGNFQTLVPVDIETLPSAKAPGVKLKGYQIALCRLNSYRQPA